MQLRILGVEQALFISSTAAVVDFHHALAVVVEAVVEGPEGLMRQARLRKQRYGKSTWPPKGALRFRSYIHQIPHAVHRGEVELGPDGKPASTLVDRVALRAATQGEEEVALREADPEEENSEDAAVSEKGFTTGAGSVCDVQRAEVDGCALPGTDREEDGLRNQLGDVHAR